MRFLHPPEYQLGNSQSPMEGSTEGNTGNKQHSLAMTNRALKRMTAVTEARECAFMMLREPRGTNTVRAMLGRVSSYSSSPSPAHVPSPNNARCCQSSSDRSTWTEM